MVLSQSALMYRPLIAAPYFNIPIVSAVYSLVFPWSIYAELLFLGTCVCHSVVGDVLMIKQETSCIYYVTQGGEQLVVTLYSDHS
jgi:hypothetical protein